MHGGTSWVAGFGAVTGGIALILTLWREVRQAARLHVNFYVFHEDTPTRMGPGASITITNTGTLPAYITSVGLIADLPWQRRWPLARAVSFRMRSRRGFGWLRGGLLTFSSARTDPTLLGRLDGADSRRGRLVDIINDQPRPMDAEEVEQLARGGQWVVVATGLRQYVARLVDNRPEGRRGTADLLAQLDGATS